MTDDPKLHIPERVLSNEGSRKTPSSSLRFLVKWADQSEAEASLESCTSMKNTETLHEYLTKLGDDWPALIPVEFTSEGEHYTEVHARQPVRRKRSSDTRTTSKPVPTRTSKRLKRD